MQRRMFIKTLGLGMLLLCGACSSNSGGGVASGGDGGAAGVGASGEGGSAGSGGTAGAGGSGVGGAGAAGGTGGDGGSAGATGCAAAAQQTSNVGCEFWAVDLPNERENDFSPFPAPDGLEWGLWVVNTTDSSGTVTVTGAAGVVATAALEPNGFSQVSLPQAQLQGPNLNDPPGPPGTQRTQSALKVETDVPVAVFQVSPLAPGFSDDVSLLLPVQRLGQRYRVVTYPPSKPVQPSGLSIKGTPEHGFVTVLAVEPNTEVSVLLRGAIEGDGQAIGELNAGDELQLSLNAFEVLNLASRGEPGDLTGTLVEADKPVVVFAGAETAHVAPPDIPDDADDCCVDHIQAQAYPGRSAGRHFVLGHSPYRSTPAEPDLFRFAAIDLAVTVSTNLPPPDDSFTVTPGAVRDVWATTSFVAEASAPVSVGQLTVSQQLTSENLGDPSLLLVPALEQTRASYTFYVPGEYECRLVITAPQGNTPNIDGQPAADCTQEDVGELQGQRWTRHECPVEAGVHDVSSDAPIAVSVFGYVGPSAIAYPAGVELPN